MLTLINTQEIENDLIRVENILSNHNGMRKSIINQWLRNWGKLDIRLIQKISQLKKKNLLIEYY